MTISFSDNSNLSLAINLYNTQTEKSLKRLTKCLRNTDTRIQFETWLIDHFTPQTVNYWYSRVVGQICVNIRQSVDGQLKIEDAKIARLIVQALPLCKYDHQIQENTSQSSIAKIIEFVKGMYTHIYSNAEGSFNINFILKELKGVPLPSTNTVLLHRLLVTEDVEGVLTLAFIHSNLAMIKIIAEKFPEEFRSILAKQNVVAAALDFFIKKYSSSSSEEKDKLMSVKSFGYSCYKQFMSLTPGIYAHIPMAIIKIPEAIEIMKKIAPSEVKIAMELQHYKRENDENEPVVAINLLDAVKGMRPRNCNVLAQSLVKHESTRTNYKNIFNKTALSLAFDFQETSLIGHEQQFAPFISMRSSAMWYNMLIKDLDVFQQTYPQLLTDSQLELFKGAMYIGANQKSYSLHELLRWIQKGYAVLLNAGFYGHLVAILIWKDQFLICNRGAATTYPIESYHFNPAKMTIQHLKDIFEIKRDSDQYTYEKFFFEKLPSELEFKMTDNDHYIIAGATQSLANQTVGNCSFVGPITAVFGLKALLETRGTDQKGRLLNQSEDKRSLIPQITKTIDWYKTWLSFVQLLVLERNIKPVYEGKGNSIIHHELIENSFKQLDLLDNSDPIFQHKLETLVNMYIHILPKEKKIEFLGNRISWRRTLENSRS